MTTIHKRAFSCCRSLKKVSFQSGSLLKTIYDCCFSESALEEFLAPPGLKEIECGAFKNCKSLRRVELNEGLVNIGHTWLSDDNFIFSDGAFQGSGIQEITLPSTLVEINENTFISSDVKKVYMAERFCMDISRLDLPKSAVISQKSQTLPRGVQLGDLRQLKYIVIPGGTTVIGSYWFCNCEIKSVAIPASATVICSGAFRGCAQLKSVTFQHGSRLEKIGEESFSGSGIEEITIPSSVTIIHARAFRKCERLKSVTFQTYMPETTMYNNTNAGESETLWAASSLRRIGCGAFYKCGSLKCVSLPEGLEVLEDMKYERYRTAYSDDYNFCHYYGVFQESGLEEITLPSTLRKIGTATFGRCNLKVVWVRNGCTANVRSNVNPRVLVLVT